MLKCLFILIFCTRCLTNENNFGKSHFAPRYTFKKVYSNSESIGMVVLGLTEIAQVKVPGSNFFTSLLASRSTSKSQETWEKIIALAKVLKKKYSGFKVESHKICYIVNVQKAMLHLIDEITNNRVKREGSTTATPPNLDDSVQKFTGIMGVVSLAQTMKDTPTEDFQKRVTLLNSIKKKLQCWVNNEDYDSITKAFGEILTLEGLEYHKDISERHLTLPISDLRDQFLNLVSIFVDKKIRFDLPSLQTYTDENACTVTEVHDDLGDEDSVSVQESSKRAEFCTSTPNLCIGNTPKQIIKSNLQDLGLKESDIKDIMLETNEAELYRKASLISVRRTIAYSNPTKVIFGKVENINYTIISNQFTGVTKSDEDLNNNLIPILESLKFLDVIFETKFVKRNVKIDEELLSCTHLNNMHTFNIMGKLHGFKSVDSDLKGFYPMPFCYAFCQILLADPYVIFENNEVGLIAETDYTYETALVLKKVSSVNVCAKQKTTTEACTFKNIKYVQQITLLKIYDYHCTIISGCAYYLEGKIIASAFITQSEFELLNEKPDMSVIENIFQEEGDEMIIKGVFYSLSTLVTIGLVGIIRQLWKWGKTSDLSLSCDCCKKSEIEPSVTRNTQMNTINRRAPIVTDPLMA